MGSSFFNLIKGRFPVPWGVRSAKKWLFHTPSAGGGVVDFLCLPQLGLFLFFLFYSEVIVWVIVLLGIAEAQLSRYRRPTAIIRDSAV